MSVQHRSSLVQSEICGHSVVELANQFSTPTFVYDAQTIRQRIAVLRQFDVIRYAQKANSNLAILDLVRREGVLVDAVSAGEIRRAQAAGYSATTPLGQPHPIVFTADIFDRQVLEIVVQEQIHTNMGSSDMIEQLGALAPGREITLRINPGFGHGHSAKTNTGGPSSKHGIWHEELDQALDLAQRHNLTVTGLHMHIGSGTDFEHLSQVCTAMEKIALQVGDTITTISAGGGLPTPYRPTDIGLDVDRYFRLWDQSRKRLEATFGHPLTLEIEPGRYLVAESGYLICEIRAVKSMGENRFYLLDAGFNNLARPILYGAYHPMTIAFAGPENEETQPVIVGGPLCESGDIFTQQDGGYVCTRDLPVASVGDYLVIHCAGAYGFVMSSNYNSKPYAAEVLVDGTDVHLIRERQLLGDLMNGERLVPTVQL
jgi:diaminopimelate decarboxylase